MMIVQAQVSLEFESEPAVWLHFRSQTENDGTFGATDVDRALACKLSFNTISSPCLKCQRIKPIYVHSSVRKSG
jgi:hypothetical protein